MTVKQQAGLAKDAGCRLGSLPGAIKDKALLNVAAALDYHREAVLDANRRDLAEAETLKIRPALSQRLALSNKKLNQLIKGLQDLAELDDPIGKRILAVELDNGLILSKVTAPIGLIGVVFESRPEALIQISSLCTKSGNALLIKGGSEAANSNRILYNLVKESLEKTDSGFIHSLHLVETREEIKKLLELDELVDLMIPRGSAELVRYIKENTRIPVLGHADGLCHIYIDRDADLEMAVKIIYDAKCQYPAVCNAVETLLIHESIAPACLSRLVPALKGVELRGDEKACALASMTPASEEDWTTEYNDLILSVKVVTDLEHAINHINQYGSRHTDAIVTANRESAELFMSLVDSSSVMWNCSTRFSDGYRYGFGAEVGVSTNKIHARGPVGLSGLTIYKYKLIGHGHTVAEYVDGRSKFTHREIAD
jgi:glutamate-5-semialdehyde dehydrogenase